MDEEPPRPRRGPPLDPRLLRASPAVRQYIAARALLAGRPILLLDEPTANLDPATGREVIEGLLSATQGGTVVVITHDLAAAARTDEIFVVEAGRTAEHGTHAELLALGGRYARMWER
jgi:ABC-type multidrug transport system fused ATPase/permease subunit